MLKLKLQYFHHLMPRANSLENRWGNNGKSDRLYFLGLQKSLQMVTAAMKLKDACSLGRKVMTNLDSILRSRDIILLTKVHIFKAMVFPVVMYGCESWGGRREGSSGWGTRV